MSGSPIVLFLNNQECEKDEFRGNIATYSTIINIITIIIFILTSLLTVDMVRLIGFNIAAIVVGTIIGVVISKKIHDRHFNKMVLILISIMGFVTVLKAL